ncbi:hypothetical protein D3C83_26430 [compost metagenome]
MVHGRKGVGGPQPAEVNRMLSTERDRVAAEFAWLEARAGHLASADTALERAFAALAR